MTIKFVSENGSFDDPVTTISYSVQSREFGSIRWKTAGRTWSKFNKAIDFGNQQINLSQIEQVRIQMTTTTVESVWQASPKIA